MSRVRGWFVISNHAPEGAQVKKLSVDMDAIELAVSLEAQEFNTFFVAPGGQLVRMLISRVEVRR